MPNKILGKKKRDFWGGTPHFSRVFLSFYLLLNLRVTNVGSVYASMHLWRLKVEQIQ